MSADTLLREAPAPASAREHDFVSLEQYFEIAAASDLKIEYLDGELFFMDGVRYEHGAIQMHIGGLLYMQLAHPEYQLLSSSVSIRARQSAYFFPDLTVVRGKARFALGRNDLLNPVLVVEVLSPSTRNHDLVDKLPVYQAMPSLEHILIIEQARPHIAHHSRAGDAWTLRQYSELDDVAPLDSLAASLSLAQVYRGIDFPA
ncbi:MAG: Uma2 family endonuclease [Chloroflexi bacterium]|nr:Uma2 family endonuclease [Chloroflexota bacterium]MCY4248464.1 Uma2 family endonuclease [Chloroflexota bacterium]